MHGNIAFCFKNVSHVTYIYFAERGEELYPARGSQMTIPGSLLSPSPMWISGMELR